MTTTTPAPTEAALAANRLNALFDQAADRPEAAALLADVLLDAREPLVALLRFADGAQDFGTFEDRHECPACDSVPHVHDMVTVCSHCDELAAECQCVAGHVRNLARAILATKETNR
jgi:hypothetical protein